MKHLEVLVLTSSTSVSKILNWKVSSVNNVETAIEKLQQRPYKVVAISKEISKTDRTKLNRITSVLFDELIVVDFKSDSALAETVKAAYWSKNKPAATPNYLDNSFEIKLANSINLK